MLELNDILLDLNDINQLFFLLKCEHFLRQIILLKWLLQSWYWSSKTNLIQNRNYSAKFDEIINFLWEDFFYYYFYNKKIIPINACRPVENMCRESTVCCVWPCLLWFFQSNVSFCRRILLKPMPHNSEPLYDNWYTVQYFSYIHFDFTVSTGVRVCLSE